MLLVCGGGLVGLRMWAGRRFVFLRRVKTLSWLSTRTGGGDAHGRHFLLEGIVMPVLPLLCPRTFGGNPKSFMDWARAAFQRRILLGVSSWMFHQPCKVWWLAATIFSFLARWCAALGSSCIWDGGFDLASASSPCGARVSAFPAWAVSSCTCMVCGFMAHVDVGVVAPGFCLLHVVLRGRGVGLGRLGG